MPQVVRNQVILNPSAAPVNQVMNTWHCVTVGATTPLSAATSFVGSLQTFYSAIDAYLSDELSGLVPLIRSFDLNDPMPRQPILESTGPTLSTGATRAPRELALCLSYKGTYLSGVSPKRKRGRIYLGPLAASAYDTSSGAGNAGAVSTIATAAGALVTASDASALYRWVIYSPTSDPNSSNPGGNAGNDPDCWDAVTEGWVDNNLDIQRRRNIAGGTRTTWT